MGRRAGNANADTNVCFAVLVEFIFAVQRNGHAVRRGDSFRGGSGLQQNSEFVATQTGRRVTLAQIGEKTAPDFLEQQVTGGVTKVIIDLLEAVEVQAEQRGRAILSRHRQHFVETLIEQNAIRQLGQDIVLRKELDAGFCAPSLGDILIGTNPSAVLERLMVDCNQSTVAELLKESVRPTAVDVRFPLPVDIFDRASRIIAHGTAVGEDIIEAHPHVQRLHRLTIDAAKLFVNQLKTVLGVVEADALRHVDDRLLEALAKSSRWGKAPGQIVPHNGKQPGQLTMSRIDVLYEVFKRHLHERSCNTMKKRHRSTQSGKASDLLNTRPRSTPTESQPTVRNQIETKSVTIRNASALIVGIDATGRICDGQLPADLGCGGIADEGLRRLGPRTHQQIERGAVRDHQQGHVDDRDRVCGSQLPRQRRKVDLDGVVIIEDDVGRPHEIEGDDERPKERTYPYREKRQHGQHPGCEVAIGGEGGEASRQIGADDAGKDEDEPEEAEAV